MSWLGYSYLSPFSAMRQLNLAYQTYGRRNACSHCKHVFNLVACLKLTLFENMFHLLTSDAKHVYFLNIFLH